MSKKLSTDTFISTKNDSQLAKMTPSMGFNQNFDLETNKPVTFQNSLVTPWAGREMIKNHFQTIWNDPNHQGDKIAVEFDRQTLMLILSQNSCEGIRFSFCQFDDKITLVAFGIQGTGKLIGEDMFSSTYDHQGILKDPPTGGEEGHGITLEEFKKVLEKKFLVDDVNAATDYFLSHSIQSHINEHTN